MSFKNDLKEILAMTIYRGITARSHPALYQEFRNLLTAAGINRKVKLVPYPDPDNDYNGKAYSKKRILISTALLDVYNKAPSITRCMLAHEIAHLKFGDVGCKIIRENFMIDWNGNNISRALTLLREMRAEIEAPIIAGLTQRRHKRIQLIYKKNNDGRSKEETFTRGYPSRDLITYYAAKYNNLSAQAVDELLNDFCNVMNITDRVEFIGKVKKKFQRWYT